VSVYPADDEVVRVVKLNTLHAVVVLNDGKCSSSCFLNVYNLILN
jgi:hypothetical protein